MTRLLFALVCALSIADCVALAQEAPGHGPFIHSFTSSGVMALPAGVPEPDIDCDLGTGYAGGSTLTCTGGTFNKTGTVTAAQATPWYPAGFAGTNHTAALFDGSTGFFSASNTTIGNPSGTKLTWLIAFEATAVGTHRLGGKSGATVGTAQYSFSLSGASLLFGMGNGSFTSSHTVGTIAAGWNVACGAYDGTNGDTASIMRSNLNGVAPADTTNARAPMLASGSQPFEIGARASGLFHDKSIAHFAVWTNFTASAAQCSEMVRKFMGSWPWTIARASARTCTPITAGASFTLGNNVPCITDTGWWIEDTTAVDAISIANNGYVPAAGGGLCAKFKTTGSTPASARIVGMDASLTPLSSADATHVEIYDGTDTTAAISDTSAGIRTACSFWGPVGGTSGVFAAPGGTAGTATTAAAFSGTIHLGSNAGSGSVLMGWVQKLCFAPNAVPFGTSQLGMCP